VLETPQFFMMAPNWIHMPLNKTHHQVLGSDQTLLIFSHIFVSFDWCKELWKHRAKLYISSFSFKSKPVTQRKNKAFWIHIICFCSNNVLFLDLIFSSILVHFQSYKNLWVHHTKLMVTYFSSRYKKEQHKKTMKNNDCVEI
jgi:hypothetical protein